MMRHVFSLGFEVEGAWDEAPDQGEIKGDGSVRCTGRYASRSEIASPVFRLIRHKSLHMARQFLVDAYPQVVDNSCGFHIHMGLADITRAAALLDSAEYQYQLFAWIERRAAKYRLMTDTMKARLAGSNDYCRTEWDGERNLFGEGHTTPRYRAVNFAALHKHGTVEVRVLPMFKQAKNAWRMMMVVVTFTEWYLRQRARRDEDSSVVLPCLASPEPETFDLEIDADQYMPVGLKAMTGGR